MEKNKSEINSFKSKHFAWINQKIQNKYEMMQKRLEKSKSVDALSLMKDDYVYNEPRYMSNKDISQIEDNHNDNTSNMQNMKYQVVIEEIKKNDADFQYLDVEQADISEHETSMLSDRNSITNTFFSDEFSGSHESINEVAKEPTNDEYQLPPTPTQTIRNKIGSRILAVKDKRRQLEKEKNANKDKKKESREKVEKFILSNTTKQDIIKVFKRTKVATVTVALIEATGLETDNLEEKLRILFCRFRLGTEKYKSKLIKGNVSEVKWQELFNFGLYDESIMEISLWDKDNCIGSSTIDIIELEKERTHKMRVNLDGEGGRVQILILLTISGISLANTLIDCDNYEEMQRQFSTARNKFAWYHLKDDSSDVGWISIIVYGAKGLAGNDCYCVLELNNERLQTHTEFKTNGPNWMKIFTFAVTDITSILHFTVHDEKKSEDIGKLSIPLLTINSGEKKWYALKDPTLRERAKGTNPRIFLEMGLTWNLVKASIRVINTKEMIMLETEDKVDRHTFARNLARAKIVLAWVMNAFRVVKTCFEWESRKMNIIALGTWLLFCWFFKMWMLPLLLLIPFFWYRDPKYFIINWKKRLIKAPPIQDDVKKEEKNTSLRQKIQGFQEMVQTVQNFIGEFASLGESIKNLFNFTVPFLSLLAIFFVVVIAFVMYMIPTKYIFMIWGIHKFTRKILRPNRIPNNEILDLLSRVPNDEVLCNCEELALEEVPNEDVISNMI